MPRIMTITQLRNELAAKEKQLDKLQAARQKVAKKLLKLDAVIAALGGEVAAPAKRLGRPPKGVVKATKVAKRATGKPLVEYVKKVLSEAKDGMRVNDIMAAVKKAGYKSAAKAFYGIVAAAVRDSKTFQKVARGIYRLKVEKPVAKKVSKKVVMRGRRKAAKPIKKVARAAVQVPEPNAEQKTAE